MTINWTNTKITLGELKPWTENPRTTTKAQAKRLLKSWEDFGQVETVAIGPDNSVYDGHQRLSALLTVHGTDYQIDARQSDRPLTDDERRKLVITLHAGAVGSWDWDKLSSWEPAQMMGDGFDADLLKDWKRDVSALDNFLKSEKPEPVDAEPQIDRAEELRQKWQVETGQLWQLGEHRLICGDCTDAATVARVMGGERADMVFTDPPYGVEFQGKGGNSIEGDISYALIPLLFADMSEIIADKCWIYVCGGSSNFSLYARMFDRYFRNWPRVIVWDKVNMTIRHNGYHSSYEFIYYTFTNGAGDLWFSGRDGEQATDVWHIQKPGNDRQHLTEKPVELPTRAIKNSCPPGGIVWEPFSGSGSTLIACEQLGRKCRAVEISPAYCGVAIERWHLATGKTPILLEN